MYHRNVLACWDGGSINGPVRHRPLIPILPPQKRHSRVNLPLAGMLSRRHVPHRGRSTAACPTLHAGAAGQRPLTVSPAGSAVTRSVATAPASSQWTARPSRSSSRRAGRNPPTTPRGLHQNFRKRPHAARWRGVGTTGWRSDLSPSALEPSCFKLIAREVTMAPIRVRSYPSSRARTAEPGSA